MKQLAYGRIVLFQTYHFKTLFSLRTHAEVWGLNLQQTAGHLKAVASV